MKRGYKYPERVLNATKVSYSVMLCGNGVGDMMPPYTVYKAEHLYDEWRTGSPPKPDTTEAKQDGLTLPLSSIGSSVLRSQLYGVSMDKKCSLVTTSAHT